MKKVLYRYITKSYAQMHRTSRNFVGHRYQCPLHSKFWCPVPPPSPESTLLKHSVVDMVVNYLEGPRHVLQSQTQPVGGLHAQYLATRGKRCKFPKEGAKLPPVHVWLRLLYLQCSSIILRLLDYISAAHLHMNSGPTHELAKILGRAWPLPLAVKREW